MRFLLSLLVVTGLVPVLVAADSSVIWWTDIGARELVPASVTPAGVGQSLHLIAPRNGVAHGQIVVHAGAAVTALCATMSTLSAVDDPAVVLPADALHLGYLTNTDPAAPQATATEALTTVVTDFIPTDASLAVVYVSVEIPIGVGAKTYGGTVTVTVTSGGTTETLTVPLQVTVAAFLMPAPADLDLWISLMQSPAQLAYAYDVVPFSEDHWRAIEASIRLLGQIGHHVLFLPVLWHANCGSGPQMVVFRQQGDTLVPDFTQLDRYLALIARYCGPQRLLVLGVWGRWINPNQTIAELAELAETLYLTGFAEDGTVAPLTLSSDYARHEALWTAVYRGVTERVGKVLGVPEDRIVLGYGDDFHPDPAIDAVWQRIAPQSMGWDAWTHDFKKEDRGPRPAFFQIADTAAPEGVDELLDWPVRSEPFRITGKAQEPFFISSCRDVQHDRSPALLYYSVPDLATTEQARGHCVGFCRIGLDFWPKSIPLVTGQTVTGDGFARDGRDRRVYPGKVVRNYRGVLTAKGPRGALPLIHFDALCEGVQAAQARLLVARASKTHPDQADAWRAVLEQQFTTGARHRVIGTGDAKAIAALTAADLLTGWTPLFTAAGQAQQALGLEPSTRAGIEAARQRLTAPIP